MTSPLTWFSIGLVTASVVRLAFSLTDKPGPDRDAALIRSLTALSVSLASVVASFLVSA